MKSNAVPLAALATCVLLSACATGPRMDDAEKLALYLRHAGEPVNSIRMGTTPMGWEKIDDQHLLLNMRPTQTYLLAINGPCLRWAGPTPTIGLSSMGSLTLSAKFDRITVPGVRVGCRIDEIRPVDLRAIRDERDRMADAR